MAHKNSIFLIIVCKFFPKQGEKTQHRGAVLDMAQELKFVDRVSDKLIQNSSVVIDVLTKKAIKTGITVQHRIDFPDLPSDDEIVAHYMKYYSDKIDEVVALHTLKTAKV